MKEILKQIEELAGKKVKSLDEALNLVEKSSNQTDTGTEELLKTLKLQLLTIDLLKLDYKKHMGRDNTGGKNEQS
jgi:hypothetical protein